MLRTTHTLRRLAVGIALAGAIGVVTVPQTLASKGYGPRDGWYSYAVAVTKAAKSPVLDGRSPDTRDAALSARAVASPKTPSGSGYQDGWYGYAVAQTKASHGSVVDGRSPDTRDFAFAAQQPVAITDGRSPDTRDFSAQAHSPAVTITRSPGFEWGDFGIGIAAALGAMLLLAMSYKLLTARKGRGQPTPVVTA